MMILLDTNILVRLSDRAQAQHQVTRDAVDLLKADRYDLVLFPQVIYEYWVVATRPVQQNGLGLDTRLVSRTVTGWISVFHLLRDERRIFGLWHDLVSRHDAKGKSAHDTRLVAAMQRHQLTHILTFNQSDFSRYSTVTALTPAEVLAGGLPPARS